MAAEAWFNIKNFNALTVRLEATSVSGEDTTSPNLVFKTGLRLTPIGQQQPPVNFTLLRMAGRLAVVNCNEAIARFESEPIALTSNSQAQDQPLDLRVPLNIRQIKRIEELRNGQDPHFCITLSALVVLHADPKEFERPNDVQFYIKIPRSHWIDNVLNVWQVSDLQLLEISSAANGRNEIRLAQKRLAQAENFYRTADYPHVLTELRSAFAALAECYACKQADQNAFGKMLVHTHPEMRDKLRQSFSYFCALFNAGPHEPSPTPEVPIPITRHDARFALVVAHAIFEYFSSENWPGL